MKSERTFIPVSRVGQVIFCPGRRGRPSAGGPRFASALVLALIALAGLEPVLAAPFGRVVPIGGRAADLALDEARRLVYVANFTANRIDVLAANGTGLQTSWSVSPQPGSVALSRDGRWLLVTHFGNFAPPAARNSLTLIQLETGARQTFALTSPPLGAAFGVDGWALVITASEFLRFDPATGTMETLGAITDYTANVLPQPAATGPPAVIAATMAASRDGRWIFCITSNYRFRYEVVPKRMLALAYVAEPPLGPRAVSVNDDGSLYTAGWGLFSRRGAILAQFENVSGLLDVGSHAIDSQRGVVYAHVPRGQGLRSTNLPPPVLEVADSENLAVRERLELAENLAGRSVLSADGRMMYAVSDSGVMFLPVGQLDQERRVVAALEDLVFRPSACDRRVMTLDLPVVDLSGQATEFQLSTTMAGLRLSVSRGVTPAMVQVSIDPTVFPASVTGTLTVTAPASIRTGESVRVVVTVTEPDQRGTPVAIPGRLVDLVADPQRDRFYVLRQDRNQVLAFDGTTRALVATWKTGQTPTQLAISFDRRFLMVGNDNSQIANVIDLDTLQPSDPVIFPGGHYPRSLASSGRATLAAARVAGPEHKIDRVDLWTRTAVPLPALGVWENDIHQNTVLVGSANGGSILAAQADGTTYLYNASADTFVVSRRDQETWSGAYAASSLDQFAIGNVLLNPSLVPVRRLGSPSAVSTGFVFGPETALRLTAPGVLERVDPASGALARPTRTLEAPAAASPESVFSRTLALLANGRTVAVLGVSGVTILEGGWDAPAVAPQIERVSNSADGRPVLAPGALISIYGRGLSAGREAVAEPPLPTFLADTCLEVNGSRVPMMFVSPDQINAQLPFPVEGNATLVLRSPSGVSNAFPLRIDPAAPSVFQLTVPGLDAPAPAIFNQRNRLLTTGSNPVKRGDAISIFLTGLGRTLPAVPAGTASPADPLAVALIPPRVVLGGVETGIEFAGLTPGSAGVYVIQARIPRQVPTGLEVPLEIQQGGATTSFHVRVID